MLNKHMIQRGMAEDMSPEMAHLVESKFMAGWRNPDNQEGVQSFLEKRDPDFSVRHRAAALCCSAAAGSGHDPFCSCNLLPLLMLLLLLFLRLRLFRCQLANPGDRLS